MSAPSRFRPALAKGRILRMNILVKTDEVELLIRLGPVEREGRNALHQAMKRGRDVGLVYEAAEVAPAHEGELVDVGL